MAAPQVAVGIVAMPKLSHFRKRGEVAMVDVTAKSVTERTAIAQGFIRIQSLDDGATQFGIVIVDHSNRDIAHELADVRLWIIGGIEDRREDEKAKCTGIAQHAGRAKGGFG